MNNRLALFKEVANRFAQKKSIRKLYTDHIYPYPYEYFNNKIYPSQICYRETWVDPPWARTYNLIGLWIMRVFWTGFFYQLFSDPGVLLGHFHPPDPALWTDAELGIPPLEYGSHDEWAKKNEEQD